MMKKIKAYFDVNKALKDRLKENERQAKELEKRRSDEIKKLKDSIKDYDARVEEMAEVQQYIVRKKQQGFKGEMVTDVHMKVADEFYHPYRLRKKWHWYIIPFPNFAYWKYRIMESRYPQKTVLARIELQNGFTRTIMVKEDEQGFIYEGKLYILDNESKKYDIDAQLWCYDFHENYSLPVKRVFNSKVLKRDYCLPLKREIPINDIRTALESTKYAEIEYASNPSLLHKFTTSKVIQLILQGVDFDAGLKFLKLMVIINTVLLVIIGIVSVFSQFGVVK